MIHIIKKLPSKLILLTFLYLISCNYKIEVDLIIHNGILYSLDDNNNIEESITEMTQELPAKRHFSALQVLLFLEKTRAFYRGLKRRKN